MKIYRFEGEHPVACEADDIQGIEAIIILTHTELENFSLPAHWKSFITGGKRCTRIDTFHGMLYISLDIPEEVGVIAAIWESGQLILSGEEHSPLLEKLTDHLIREEGPSSPASCTMRGLQLLLTLAADHHQALLENIEEAITVLEAQVMRYDPRISGRNFIDLRRTLLALKRHTQPLEEICDILHENEGNLLPAEATGILAPIFRRCGRINAEIVNLENYAAQVRDAYQNHLDLRLNRTMMTLTVLAAIFLPLSLIVGWYGMNFPMPEFTWRWGYGYVIALSVLCLILSIGYFRRKGML